VDGTRVIVLDKLSMGSRSWTGGFFCPIIHAAPRALSVERILPPDEADPWLEKLRAARAAAS
jgi:hypothetical protein